MPAASAACGGGHEFEGLLFSDCQALAHAIGKPALATAFQAIRDGFSSPEEINDCPETHPSRRIQELVPEYEKPLYGNLAALELGLGVIRNECPRFSGWLERLERCCPGSPANPVPPRQRGAP